jgi:hypothetical protein
VPWQFGGDLGRASPNQVLDEPVVLPSDVLSASVSVKQSFVHLRHRKGYISTRHRNRKESLVSWMMMMRSVVIWESGQFTDLDDEDDIQSYYSSIFYNTTSSGNIV